MSKSTETAVIEASHPLTLNLILKDFMENDSRLEYTGELDDWKALDYDHSSWTATTLHSASGVSPKDGYDEIG